MCHGVGCVHSTAGSCGCRSVTPVQPYRPRGDRQAAGLLKGLSCDHAVGLAVGMQLRSGLTCWDGSGWNVKQPFLPSVGSRCTSWHPQRSTVLQWLYCLRAEWFEAVAEGGRRAGLCLPDLLPIHTTWQPSQQPVVWPEHGPGGHDWCSLIAVARC
jgi:hypothetical protein